MLKTIACTLFAASLLLALNQDKQDRQDKQDKQEKKTDSQPAKAADSPPGIPAGAKEIQPYLFRYVDEKGKVWMYRQTPFGVSKWEYQPAPPPPAQTSNPVKVTDLGDSYRFESNSPTGVQKWERKKTELTAYEKDMVQKDEERRHASDSKPADANDNAAKPSEKKQ